MYQEFLDLGDFPNFSCEDDPQKNISEKEIENLFRTIFLYVSESRKTMVYVPKVTPQSRLPESIRCSKIQNFHYFSIGIPM